MIEVFALLIIFQFKHLIADYYLQFPYMYENKGAKEKWFLPLYHHASIHSIGTFLILLPIAPRIALIAGLFDLVTHFGIDRWKATRGSKPDESKFWKELGIDQMLHHIVGIIIIFGYTIYS